MIEGYIELPNGIIKQENPTPIDYNVSYVEQRYNTYGALGMQMAFLRLGYLFGVIDETPKSILDVGYGNGDFLKACSRIIPNCYGNDISGYPIPEKCEFIDDITENEYDVISLFDVLEHFTDISFVKELKCKFIIISVPNCHNDNDTWFYEWKHRRPHEHIFHFNPKSLCNFMEECGFEVIEGSNVEDAIRTPVCSKSNILTMIFKKTIEE